MLLASVLLVTCGQGEPVELSAVTVSALKIAGLRARGAGGRGHKMSACHWPCKSKAPSAALPSQLPSFRTPCVCCYSRYSSPPA